MTNNPIITDLDLFFTIPGQKELEEDQTKCEDKKKKGMTARLLASKCSQTVEWVANIDNRL